MDGYAERREELSRRRRWAPYAVAKQGVLAAAIEAISIRDGDEVLDIGCDLGAFRDELMERRPRARYGTVFDELGLPVPDASEGAPPDAVRLASDAVALRRGGAVKVFGTFVDKMSREDEAVAVEALGERAGTRWGRLVGALLASSLSRGGRAAVIVHAGDLSSSTLADARRELVARGILERVVHLPQDSLVGRLVTTALLVLSEDSPSVLVTDLRGAEPSNPEMALAISGDASAPERRIPCEELTDGPCDLGPSAVSPRAPADPLLPVVGDLAEVFAGANVSRDAQDAGDGTAPEDTAVAVPPSLLPTDGVLSDPLETGDPRSVSLDGVPKRALLREGDVLVPRSGNNFFAIVVEGMPAGPGGRRLLATSNVIVIRPAPHVDPYFLAAMLNSPLGVAATLKGGPIRHTGVREVRFLPIPTALGTPDAMSAVGDWYRRALARRRAARLAYERACDSLTNGLSDIGGSLPGEAGAMRRQARVGTRLTEGESSRRS